MKIIRLKPCPFCGAPAHLTTENFPRYVYCTKCDAMVPGIGWEEEGEKDAVKKWNRRIEK